MSLVWSRPVGRELGGTVSLRPCPGGDGHSQVLTLPGKWAGEGTGIAGWPGARSPSSWNRICLCLRRGCGALGLQTEAAHFPRAFPRPTCKCHGPPSKGHHSSFSPDLLRDVSCQLLLWKVWERWHRAGAAAAGLAATPPAGPPARRH